MLYAPLAGNAAAQPALALLHNTSVSANAADVAAAAVAAADAATAAIALATLALRLGLQSAHQVGRGRPTWRPARSSYVLLHAVSMA